MFYFLPLSRTNHEVQIRLTSSGVPVSVADYDTDEIFPTDFTIQPTIPYVDPLNVVGIVNTEGESDEPLFRLTITRFTKLNSSSIGTSRSHVLCEFSDFPISLTVLTRTTSVDGSGFLLFFRHLSQLYQGLEPIDPPPYYEPEAIKFVEPLRTCSPFLNRFGSPVPPPRKRPERNVMEFVAFRLTATQLTEIHNCVTKGMEDRKITRMDIVTGLLARCLSEIEPESKSINTILYVVNVRAFVAPRPIRLTCPSIAEWAYTLSMRRVTRSFTSPQDYNSRTGSTLTTMF